MTLEQAKEILKNTQMPMTAEQREQYMQALRVVAGSFVGTN